MTSEDDNLDVDRAERTALSVLRRTGAADRTFGSGIRGGVVPDLRGLWAGKADSGRRADGMEQSPARQQSIRAEVKQWQSSKN